jgi:diphthamide synthase (EF-2-diphthine--ammonia ligase)
MNQLLEYEKKYSISAIGEGGEIETFVLNGPMYIHAHIQLNFESSTIEEESQHCAYVSQIDCKLVK